MSNTFAQVNNAAHTGALGNNRLPMPSNAQLDAGNYAKGHIRINGLDVAIENPAYTYRKSTDKTGQQWSCLMQAHYGYINGYKGNDGDNVDVFVGNVPENDTAYIINQKTQGGFFDEHKVMLGFLSQQQAVDTYQHCFERGWTGLMSVVPCTMSQLKWWLANGDKSRPVTRERLPYAGLERLDSVVWGGTDDANLYSHGGQLSKLLYQIRLDDANNQALEPLAYHDMIAELGNQGFMYENYDALIVEYNKLERKAKQLLMVMQGAADTVKPVGVTVSKPLTKNGVSNVIAWFEMDDGQAVGVFFHNPDKNPKKLDPTDEMISYKWVLNKKDITIAVAPENGKDVIIRTVAKRIMQLVEKNHDRFAKANSDKAELNQKEQSLGQLVIEKQSQLDMLNSDIEALEAKKAEKEANKAPTAEELTKQGFDGIATELKKLGWTDDLVMGGLTKSFVGAKESGSVNEDGVLNVNVSRENGLIRAQVGADTLIPNSVDNIPQYGLNAQTEQSYKKVADKVNNAVDAYVEQRKVELAINGKSTLSANQSTDYGFTFIKDDFDKNKYRLLDADGKEYQVIWKSGSTWTMMTGETFKTLADAKNAAIDHALNRKETERQEKASRAEVDGMRTVKRKPVSVFVYWSESSLFTENTSYPFAEFEALAFAAAMKNTEGGYDKTKVKVTFDDGFVYSDIRVDLNTKETGFKSLVKSTLDYYKAKNIVNEDQQLLSTFDFSGVSPVVPVQPTIEPVAQVVEPASQERPSNWRTNLANARAVAKSLGIETKGKKLDRLVKDIDIFDDNEVKKELLAEFKGLASRLVLPKGYIFDLSDAEKSIGDITRNTEAWIRKQGKIDTNTIRVELRTIPDSSQGIIFNSVHIYTDDPKTKKDFDKFSYQRFGDIGASSPETPKEIIAKMELFLTKAILPEIEYQKVKNSTTLDTVDLPSLGVANIESIGDENIYIEKDGKYYISKVGNTEDYALGEWDFAEYPEGKKPTVEQAVEAQPEPVSEPPMTNPDRDYLQSIIDGKDTGLAPKEITAKMRTIITAAREAKDTETMALGDLAAKAYAAQTKAKAAAKLAEVQ